MPPFFYKSGYIYKYIHRNFLQHGQRIGKQQTHPIYRNLAKIPGICHAVDRVAQDGHSLATGHSPHKGFRALHV